MTLTNSAVLYFDYTSIGIFGVFFLLYLLAGQYYALKGYEMISRVGSYSMLVALMAHIACVLDAYTDGLSFTRPIDGVVVHWGRFVSSFFIIPFTFLAFFQILHRPSWGEYDGSKKPEKSDKHANWQHIWHNSKLCVVLLSVSSSAFQMVTLICGDSSIRWFTYIMFAVTGLLAFLLTYTYVLQIGIKKWRKHHVTFSNEFKTSGKNAMVAAFIGWALFLLSWLTIAVILPMGHSFYQLFSYDFEVTAYIVAHIVILFALIAIAWHAYRVQHKENHHQETKKVM